MSYFIFYMFFILYSKSKCFLHDFLEILKRSWRRLIIRIWIIYIVMFDFSLVDCSLYMHNKCLSNVLKRSFQNVSTISTLHAHFGCTKLRRYYFFKYPIKFNRLLELQFSKLLPWKEAFLSISMKFWGKLFRTFGRHNPFWCYITWIAFTLWLIKLATLLVMYEKYVLCMYYILYALFIVWNWTDIGLD